MLDKQEIMAIEFNFGGPNGFGFDADGLFPPGEAGPKGDTGDTGLPGQGVDFGYIIHTSSYYIILLHSSIPS
jgi:hypothetical protein